MSIFSYISFPRKVDKSCLKSNFDHSKTFTVAELRETAFAAQFEGNLDELPDELDVYLGDFSDFHGIAIFDLHGEVFNDIFENKYVYCFQASFKVTEKHNSRMEESVSIKKKD